LIWARHRSRKFPKGWPRSVWYASKSWSPNPHRAKP
jgi:hypothetical protein